MSVVVRPKTQGLFAKRDIQKGEKIINLVGHKYSPRAFVQHFKTTKVNKSFHLIASKPFQILVPVDEATHVRKVSDEKRVNAQKILLHRQRKRRCKRKDFNLYKRSVVIAATRNIKKGEEILLLDTIL
jgi:hypothetical protein